ncbi:hypothetical protein JP74_08995 [Devosia sp. 17-2-E-8]|nr:hypothetical protein JP74_08995 [Devosia sp. 17-2-E-8]
MMIQSKADRDRLRNRAAGNRKIVDELRRIAKSYEQGRAASACMSDIVKLIATKPEKRRG